MKGLTKRFKSRKCTYCGIRFELKTRGRPQAYCKRSHRQRAYQKRKIAEIEQPPLRLRRQLQEALNRLERQRTKWAYVVERFRRKFPGAPRPAPYERSVSKVHELLRQLAPEVLESAPVLSPKSQIKLEKFSEVFRSLSMKYHPDLGGDKNIMQDLNGLRDALFTDIARARA